MYQWEWDLRQSFAYHLNQYKKLYKKYKKTRRTEKAFSYNIEWAFREMMQEMSHIHGMLDVIGCCFRGISKELHEMWNKAYKIIERNHKEN